MPQNSYTLPEPRQKVLGYNEDKDEYSVIFWDDEDKGWRKCDSPESLWKLSYFTTWEYLPNKESEKKESAWSTIGPIVFISFIIMLILTAGAFSTSIPYSPGYNVTKEMHNCSDSFEYYINSNGHKADSFLNMENICYYLKYGEKVKTFYIN